MRLPSDWERLREHLAVMADPQVSVRSFNDHDTHFHVAIARASGNPLVTEMTTALRNAMRGTLLRAADRNGRLPRRPTSTVRRARGHLHRAQGG